jgi:MFS family permease
VFAFIGLMSVLTQGLLFRRLLPIFGEARLAITGTLIMALGFGAIAIVSQSWMLFPVMGLVALGSGMASPSITSLISRRVSPQEQGTTLGGAQALTSLTMVVGPLYAGYIFGAIGMAAPYLSGAALLIGAAIVIGTAVRGSVPASMPVATTMTVQE